MSRLALRASLIAAAVAVPVAASVLATAPVASAAGGTAAAARPAAATAATDPAALAPIGVYVGGAASITHRAMETWSGGSLPYALDFAAAANGWADMEDPGWLFWAWRGTPYRLVYSLQMFPHSVSDAVGGPGALRQCASGAFDGHWHTLAANLVANQLASTVVRPGWEMNGNWFGWSAGGHTADYISCFRHVVSTMRAVSGQHFAFDWNPSIGAGQFPAEQAYPGDDVVDVVGPDLYDTSWAPHTYHDVAGQTAAQRQAAVESAWQAKYSGDHGLQWWSAFASAHGKSLSMPEWGLALRHDGYGGGDDPYFIQKMFDFIYDPGNHVLFATYFNFASPDGEHRLYGSTAFPQAAALFRSLVAHPPVHSDPACAVTAPAPAAPSTQALVNGATDRSAAAPLDGATVTGDLHTWLVTGADATVSHVQFFVDDPTASRAPAHDEWSAPFDLGGTGAQGSLPYSTASWSAGIHTVTTKTFFKNGTQQLTTASVLKPAAGCATASVTHGATAGTR